MKIGIDIGKVIIGGGKEADTSFFSDNFLLTPMISGAYSSIAKLKEQNHELHIISKCGIEIEEKSVAWLEEQGFFELIPQHRVHFVRKRNLKSPMAEALELDVFIDDRIDVLQIMEKYNDLYTIQFLSWNQVMEDLALIFKLEGINGD